MDIWHLDNQRDMADELFHGNVTSEMTLGEAIIRGILNSSKYVLSAFSYQMDLEKLTKIQPHQEQTCSGRRGEISGSSEAGIGNGRWAGCGFAKHMPRNNGKYIAFCANAEHMREMIGKVPAWFSGVDIEPHVYSAYSNDPEASQAFLNFKADTGDHLNLLFCIDMLNEGVDVEAIDGVILLRPTVFTNSKLAGHYPLQKAEMQSFSLPSLSKTDTALVPSKRKCRLLPPAIVPLERVKSLSLSSSM